jgi:hypothetical protein
MPEVWGGYPVRKDFIERADFRERASTGIRNLELLYTSTQDSRDLPSHYFGRAAGLRSLWIAISPFVLQRSHPPLQELLARGERVANDRIHPAPNRADRSALYE